MALNRIKSTLKSLMSNGGIFLLLTVYVTAGAYLFQLFEYDKVEKANSQFVQFSRDNELYFSTMVYKYMWPARFAHNFSSYVDFSLENFKDRVTLGLNTSLYYVGEELSAESLRNSWTFTSALLFTTTTVTTIGYGHVCPTTNGGKIFVIFYSLFGIPLMLTFLANIGEWMAGVFRALYYGCCCSVFLTKRRKHYDRMRRKAESWNRTMRKKKRLAQRKSFTYGCQKNRPPEESHVTLGYDQGARTNSQNRLRTTVSDKIDLVDVESLYGANDFYAPIENPDDWTKPNFPISLTLGVIGAYIVLGAVLFSSMYGWSRTTAAYFSFVTLSTIGFGDYIPHWSDLRTSNGKAKMIASIIYIIFGMAVLSMCFNLMIEEIVAKFSLLMPSTSTSKTINEGKQKISTSTIYGEKSTYCSRKSTIVRNEFQKPCTIQQC